MYTVNVFNINAPSTQYKLHDPTGYGERRIINSNLDMEINASGSFDFTLLPNHPEYSRVDKPMYQIVEVLDGSGGYVWEGRITSIEVDMYAQKKVSCEGAMSFLGDTYIDPVKYTKKLVGDFLDDMLKVHNSKCKHDASKIYLRNVTKASTKKVSGTLNYQTPLEAISTMLVKRWGGYIKIDKVNGKLYLDYLSSPGGDNNQAIAYGENLISFTRERDLTDVYTAVVPLGASTGAGGEDDRLTIESVNSGKKYVYKTDDGDTFINTYGWIYKVISNSDIDDADELKKWGEEQLEEMDFDRVTCTVTAVDLSLIDTKLDRLKLGSKVSVVSKIHNFNRVLPIVSIKGLDVTDPRQAKYTLGLAKRTNLTGLIR